MPFTVNRYNSDSFNTGFPLTIPDNTVNTTATSIKILGRGVPRYAEVVAETLVHMLEHFAGNTAPASPITGQLWFDASPTSPGAGQLKVFNGNNFVTVGGTQSGLISNRPLPSNSRVGDFYFATDTTERKLYYFDGTAWTPLTGAIASNTAPTSPKLGDLWLDTTVSPAILKYWNGTSWASIAGGSSLTQSNIFTTPAGEIEAIMVNGQYLGIWAPASITNSNLPTVLQPFFPSGVNVGLNLSNVANNKFRGTATEAEYADIAERYEADANYIPGTVLKLGGEKEVTQTTTSLDTNYFGIVSTSPGYLLNSNAGNDETHPKVALVGRVPVRCIGVVKKFDRLVPSNIPGVAMVLPTEYKLSDVLETIIGRALEDKNTTDEGLVMTVVGKN